MSNALATVNSGFPTPQEFEAMKSMAVYAVSSGLLPVSVNTKEKALIIVMKSRALGIDPMHGLWSISVINGKPCMSAELMQAVILKNIPGFKIDVLKTDNIECIIEATRPGGKPVQFSFTIDDAKRAQIYKNVWLTYPAAMLRARVVSAMARFMAPDALAGIVYTPEEMGADVDGNGNLRDVTPPTDPTPTKQPVPKPDEKKEDSAQSNMSTLGIEDAGDFVITKAKKDWENKTIREVVDVIGLPAFQKDVEWWATQSGRKGFREIQLLRSELERFVIQLQNNHIDEINAAIARDSFAEAGDAS